MTMTKDNFANETADYSHVTFQIFGAKKGEGSLTISLWKLLQDVQKPVSFLLKHRSVAIMLLKPLVFLLFEDQTAFFWSHLE